MNIFKLSKKQKILVGIVATLLVVSSTTIVIGCKISEDNKVNDKVATKELSQKKNIKNVAVKTEKDKKESKDEKSKAQKSVLKNEKTIANSNTPKETKTQTTRENIAKENNVTKTDNTKTNIVTTSVEKSTPITTIAKSEPPKKKTGHYEKKLVKEAYTDNKGEVEYLEIYDSNQKFIEKIDVTNMTDNDVYPIIAEKMLKYKGSYSYTTESLGYIEHPAVYEDVWVED